MTNWQAQSNPPEQTLYREDRSPSPVVYPTTADASDNAAATRWVFPARSKAPRGAMRVTRSARMAVAVSSCNEVCNNSCTHSKLLDRLIRTREQGRRDGETERLRGFEVDNELVLGRRLHRKIGWLLSLENSIHVASRLPVLLDEVRSVSNEAAGRNDVAIGVDRWQLVPSRKFNDRCAKHQRQRARCHDQAAVRGASKRHDRAFDLADVAQADRAQFHTARRRHGLNCGKLTCRGGDFRVPKDRHACHGRGYLFEQLKPFSTHAVCKGGEARGVGARPR